MASPRVALRGRSGAERACAVRVLREFGARLLTGAPALARGRGMGGNLWEWDGRQVVSVRGGGLERRVGAR